MDDPLPELFMPHLTIMNSDPSWDKRLRDRLLEKHWKKSERKEKRGKGAAKVDDEEGEGELFGWDYKLMRDVRNEFSKMSFGVQKVEYVELQSGYLVLEKIPLVHKLDVSNTMTTTTT